MNEKKWLYLEFLFLFVLLPLSFLIAYPIAIKAVLTILSFGYIIWYLSSNKAFTFYISPSLWKPFLKQVAIRFLVVIILMTGFTYFFYNDTFFNVLLNNPKLWFFILFVYSFFSVTFQELVYRTFFFKRYQQLFPKKEILIVANAFVFSLAHIFLKNILVLFLTFIGGIAFALTYYRSKSTTLVCIEHALYGFWLFTVGLGEILAFPGDEMQF
jgi:membrane protease YdiL (CAAX protease family)